MGAIKQILENTNRTELRVIVSEMLITPDFHHLGDPYSKAVLWDRVAAFLVELFLVDLIYVCISIS